MKNYISYNGVIVFFNDEELVPLPPPGGAVFRRPQDKRWADVPQIIGEYSEEPQDYVEDWN